MAEQTHTIRIKAEFDASQIGPGGQQGGGGGGADGLNETVQTFSAVNQLKQLENFNAHILRVDLAFKQLDLTIQALVQQSFLQQSSFDVLHLDMQKLHQAMNVVYSQTDLDKYKKYQKEMS